MTRTKLRMVSLRQSIYSQLEAGHPATRGLTVTNWILTFLILFSLVLYTVETEDEIKLGWEDGFAAMNVMIIVVFAIEFALRLCAVGIRPEFRGWRGLNAYVRRNPFMVVVDFLAFAPELLFLVLGGVPPSWLRSLRVFRLFKLARYVPAVALVANALRSCVQELMVALSLSGIVWYLAAVLLYLAEGAAQPEEFGSITRAMWWSVVTLTSVGYGDAIPVTVLGKLAAGVFAVVGLGAVALPSGIIAGAFLQKFNERRQTRQAEDAAPAPLSGP